jgi:hypothetical protein
VKDGAGRGGSKGEPEERSCGRTSAEVGPEKILVPTMIIISRGDPLHSSGFWMPFINFLVDLTLQAYQGVSAVSGSREHPISIDF